MLKIHISGVTIGRVGKTPRKLCENETSYTEHILEGKQYGDSYRQGEIYCNAEKRSLLFAKLEKMKIYKLELKKFPSLKVLHLANC